MSDILYEWRIRDIERVANEAARRLHELDTNTSNVASMECSLREIFSEINGLRTELESAQEKINELETEVKELRHFLNI